MTICIDASRAAVKIKTGTETVSASVIQALVGLPEAQQHTFLLYSPEALPADFFESLQRSYPRSAAIHTRVVGTQRPWLLHFARALRSDAHVIDALYVPSHIVPPFGLPQRTVTMIHGMEWEQAPWAYDWFERRIQSYATRHALHVCQHIIVPSQATKNVLTQWAKMHNYPVPRIHVAPHGLPNIVENRTVAAQNHEYLHGSHDLNIPKQYTPFAHAPFFLMIGRQQKRKQIPQAIHAFERFVTSGQHPHNKTKQVQDNTTPRLIIAGPDGNGTAEIQVAIKNSSVQTFIHSIGGVSETEKAWLLNHAIGLLYVSAAEGFGLPVLEAAHARTPLIISDDAAIQETYALVKHLYDRQSNTQPSLVHIVNRHTIQMQLPHALQALYEVALQANAMPNASTLLDHFKQSKPSRWRIHSTSQQRGESIATDGTDSVLSHTSTMWNVQAQHILHALTAVPS